MATRKLKFKPKPIVDGLGRKGRNKNDLSEIALNNSSHSVCHPEKISENLFKEGGIKGFVKDAEEHSFSNSDNINTSKLRNEQNLSQSILSDNLTDIKKSTIDELNFNANDHNDTSTLDPINREKTDICSIISNYESEPFNEHSQPFTSSSKCINSDIVEPEIKYNRPQISGTSKVADVIPVVETAQLGNNASVGDESASKDPLVSEKPIGKPDSLKGFPRFGRFRCKPILINSGLRKKSDVRTTKKASISPLTPLSKTLATKPSTRLSHHPHKRVSFHGSDSEDEIKQKCSNDTNHETKLTKKRKNSNLSTENSEVETINVISSTKALNSPLKPTSKILVPKPSPRLSDISHRRISFQGSDSEDELKRKSSNNINHEFITKSLTENKDLKNKKRKRSQGSTYSKLGHDTLQKLSKKCGKDEQPDKSKLTMLDLIFYNPKNNPMTVNAQQQQPKFSNARKKEESEVNEVVEEALVEQSVDDVEPAVYPVPKLKVGPDGQVMLDPQSLVIEATGIEKSRAELEKSEIVQETGITRYTTYSKRKHSRCDWSPQETLQFYKALNTIGSDFSLMAKLFPKRSRHELKLKFKREEKTNLQLVDKAMTSPADFNFKSLEEELQLENEAIERIKVEKILEKERQKKERAEKKKEKLKNKEKKPAKNRSSWKGIKLKSSALNDFNETDTGKIHCVKNKSEPKKPRTKKRVNKKVKKQDYDIIDSDLEKELQIDLDMNSADDEEEGLSIIKMVKETCIANYPKKVRRLKEREEINETLKKKLCRVSDSDDDEYTPNGDVLFGTPPREAPDPEQDENIEWSITVPSPAIAHEGFTEETKDKQWNITIQSLPTIEETVSLHNVEDVSEISELGSFGQNDTALDLSMPVRANIQKEFLRETFNDNPLLNRQIISESIQIIDQLTSNVESNGMYTAEDGTNVSQEDVMQEDQSSTNKMPLPSFESVSRSRPSMAYPLQTPLVRDNESETNDRSNPQSIVPVLANYYNEDEKCILGD